MLSKERLWEVLDYHEDGTLTWKRRPKGSPGWNSSLEGREAGTLRNDGYLMVSVDGCRILNHRAIFLMHKGYLPEKVDHKDTIRTHNWIDNLREATTGENACNRAAPNKNNLVGHKNISQRGNKYRVTISRKGNRYSKTCSSLEEAIKWRDQTLLEIHGVFANNGDNK